MAPRRSGHGAVQVPRGHRRFGPGHGVLGPVALGPVGGGADGDQGGDAVDGLGHPAIAVRALGRGGDRRGHRREALGQGAAGGHAIGGMGLQPGHGLGEVGRVGRQGRHRAQRGVIGLARLGRRAQLTDGQHQGVGVAHPGPHVLQPGAQGRDLLAQPGEGGGRGAGLAHLLDFRLQVLDHAAQLGHGAGRRRALDVLFQVGEALLAMHGSADTVLARQGISGEHREPERHRTNHEQQLERHDERPASGHEHQRTRCTFRFGSAS